MDEEPNTVTPAARTYAVRFGNRTYADEFGFTGRGTVSIEGTDLVYAGKQVKWSPLRQILAVVALFLSCSVIVSLIAWLFGGPDYTYLGPLIGLASSGIVVSLLRTSRCRLAIPIATMRNARRDKQCVVFTGRALGQFREGFVELDSDASAADLHGQLLAALDPNVSQIADREAVCAIGVVCPTCGSARTKRNFLSWPAPPGCTSRIFAVVVLISGLVTALHATLSGPPSNAPDDRAIEGGVGLLMAGLAVVGLLTRTHRCLACGERFTIA